MIRRALVALALLAAASGVTPVMPAARAAEQAGCEGSLGLGGRTPIDTNYCNGLVRPGVEIRTSTGGCTANFVFSGANGKRYLGTAGHCLLDGQGETTTFASPTVQAYASGWRTIGRAAYAVLSDERDFALIELDPSVTAVAEMAHFGGPTGVYTGQSLAPEIVHHYGYGLVLGEVIPARTSIAPNTVGHYRVGAEGAVIFGDSGGPAITEDGRALGVIVTLGHVGSASAGTVGISRLDVALSRAETWIGTSLTLQTAPLRY